MNPTLRQLARLVRETARAYADDEVPRFGAALAYYTVFSMAPALVIAVSIATLVLGPDAATGQLGTDLRGSLGDTGAEIVVEAIASSSEIGGGVVATLVGVATLVLGASRAFLELQTALDRVWHGKALPHRGWVDQIRRQLVSVGIVLVIGPLLIVSTILTTAVAGVGEWASGRLEIPQLGLQSLNFAASCSVVALLFALIYKLLPDAEVEWGDVWVGALATSFLFTTGMLALGLFIGHGLVASTFGAAGAAVVLLVWVYCSAQLLLIGAEFTRVWSRYRGPRHGAEAARVTAA